MRKLIMLSLAAAALCLAGALALPRAEAAPITAPNGLGATVQDQKLAEDAAYVCHRRWRCGPYGCGWRRVCWWSPGPYSGYYGGSYGYGYGYYPRHRYYRGW